VEAQEGQMSVKEVGKKMHEAEIINGAGGSVGLGEGNRESGVMMHKRGEQQNGKVCYA
jgi:hypothetical protein